MGGYTGPSSPHFSILQATEKRGLGPKLGGSYSNGKLSYSARKLSYSDRKLSYSDRKLSYTIGSCHILTGSCHILQEVIKMRFPIIYTVYGVNYLVC